MAKCEMYFKMNLTWRELTSRCTPFIILITIYDISQFFFEFWQRENATYRGQVFSEVHDSCIPAVVAHSHRANCIRPNRARRRSCIQRKIYEIQPYVGVLVEHVRLGSCGKQNSLIHMIFLNVNFVSIYSHNYQTLIVEILIFGWPCIIV
jgi:tyrosine-protein phosphatase YwqE